MDLAYYTLDVFTDRMFGGNPLGVVPDAVGLDPATMQSIARELNLSETVFLLPPETPWGTRRLRIFTPAHEVPFAGHPTVGAAWYLVESGEVPAMSDGVTTLVLEENVGPVTVEVRTRAGWPEFVRFQTAVLPERRPGPDRAICAQLLSLTEDEIGEPGWEPEMVSCGLPFLVIPVRDVDALGRSRLDPAAWEEHLEGAWARAVYPITPRPLDSGVDLRVRMYAPSAGVPEDPATGSAAAALAGYMAKRAPGDGSYRWRIEQGVEMGRPSLIEAEADVSGGQITAVRVGGTAVAVGRGTMTIPTDDAG